MYLYTLKQLEYIRNNRSDLRPKTVPKLDAVIVEFLKKFDVFVQPVTSKTKRTGENIASGVLTGLVGPDVGLDAAQLSGQNKQTLVQEWIQWKQWALSHKDFEAYKEERIDKIVAFNKSIEDKLSDPEFQKELEPLLKRLKENVITNRKKESEETSNFGLLALLVIVGGAALFGLYSQQNPEPKGWNKQNIERYT